MRLAAEVVVVVRVEGSLPDHRIQVEVGKREGVAEADRAQVWGSPALAGQVAPDDYHNPAEAVGVGADIAEGSPGRVVVQVQA